MSIAWNASSSFSLLLAVLLIPVSLTSALGDDLKAPSPTGDTIIAPGEKLQHLFTRTAKISGGLTESPAVAPDGSIYFSDIAFGKDPGMIHRYDPITGDVTVFSADSHKSNGLFFDSQGRMLACEGSGHGGRAIVRYDMATGERTVLTDRFEGKRYNAPNDLCLDAAGRIYFTDPRYVGDEPRELAHMSVYRIDLDGTVHEVTRAVSKPNGIAISPNGHTLYVAEHNNGTDKIDPDNPPKQQGLMRIIAFPLHGDGIVGKGRVLIDFGKEKGCDGMCVDSKGNLYLTVRSAAAPGVRVFTPAGKEIARIPTGPLNQQDAATPVGLPSNVEFGVGDDNNMLYITVDKSLYRIRLAAIGFHRGDDPWK